MQRAHALGAKAGALGRGEQVARRVLAAAALEGAHVVVQLGRRDLAVGLGRLLELAGGGRDGLGQLVQLERRRARELEAQLGEQARRVAAELVAPCTRSR